MPQSLFLKRGIVKGKQKPILVYVPTEWISELDNLVDKKLYANRNEAIRASIRDLLKVHSATSNSKNGESEMNISKFGMSWILIQAGGFGYFLSFILNKWNLESLLLLIPMAIFAIGLRLNLKAASNESRSTKEEP